MPIRINGSTDTRVGRLSSFIDGFGLALDGSNAAPADRVGSINPTMSDYSLSLSGQFAVPESVDGEISATLGGFGLSFIGNQVQNVNGALDIALGGFSSLLQSMPADVGSLRFYDSITQGDYEGRCRILLPNSGVGINVENDFTYEFWLAPSSISSDNNNSTSGGANNNWINCNIIIDRDLFNTLPAHGFGLSNGRLCFGVSVPGAERTIIGSRDLRDGLFHHVALTRDESTGVIEAYADGSREATGAGGTGSVAVPNGHSPISACGPGGNELCIQSDPYFVIGTEKHDVQTNGYRGLMSELRISDSVRYTGTTYTVPTNSFTSDANTVGLWHFDEQSGTIASDSSGNNQDCVLRVDSNGPTWESDTPF